MLAGIGGRTIVEAKQRLSYSEFLSWIAYRRKRGSLNASARADHGFALLASMYANAHSKRGGHKIIDFMPHMEEQSLTLEQAMEQWS